MTWVASITPQVITFFLKKGLRCGCISFSNDLDMEFKIISTALKIGDMLANLTLSRKFLLEIQELHILAIGLAHTTTFSWIFINTDRADVKWWSIIVFFIMMLWRCWKRFMIFSKESSASFTSKAWEQPALSARHLTEFSKRLFIIPATLLASAMILSPSLMLFR